MAQRLCYFLSNKLSVTLLFDVLPTLLSVLAAHQLVALSCILYSEFLYPTMCVCLSHAIYSQAWNGMCPTIWRGLQIADSLWKNPISLSAETGLWTTLLGPGVCIRLSFLQICAVWRAAWSACVLRFLHNVFFFFCSPSCFYNNKIFHSYSKIFSNLFLAFAEA